MWFHGDVRHTRGNAHWRQGRLGTADTGETLEIADTGESLGTADTETVGMGNTESNSKHGGASLCNSLWLLKMRKILWYIAVNICCLIGNIYCNFLFLCCSFSFSALTRKPYFFLWYHNKKLLQLKKKPYIFKQCQFIYSKSRYPEFYFYMYMLT